MLPRAPPDRHNGRRHSKAVSFVGVSRWRSVCRRSRLPRQGGGYDPSDIEFFSDPVPRRIAAQRRWPRILGYWADLDDLILHLEDLADRGGIRRYWRREGGVGQAAQYNQRDKSIAFARETRDHRPLYGWVLAHELGHALDPWLGAFGPVEYGPQGNDRATATYELIAEASALCCFWSFGLHVERFEPHLLSLGGKKWQRKLFREAYNDRLWAAAGVMCKPLPCETQDQYFEASKYVRKVRRRQRRVRRAIRHKCRRYGDKPAPYAINLERADPPKPPKDSPEGGPPRPPLPPPPGDGSDYEAELEELLVSVKYDDDARQRFLDLLDLLGPDDPRASAWRKRLSAALF